MLHALTRIDVCMARAGEYVQPVATVSKHTLLSSCQSI